MPIIEKEYPEGVAVIEMQLVRMLCDKRSWNDYRKISSALSNVRQRAKAMQSERSNLMSHKEVGSTIK